MECAKQARQICRTNINVEIKIHIRRDDAKLADFAAVAAKSRKFLLRFYTLARARARDKTRNFKIYIYLFIYFMGRISPVCFNTR